MLLKFDECHHQSTPAVEQGLFSVPDIEKSVSIDFKDYIFCHEGQNCPSNVSKFKTHDLELQLCHVYME